MTTKQTEALRLADAIKASGQFTPLQNLDAAAAELRLLHAENEALRAFYDAARLEIESLHAQLEAIGAGGVGPLVGAPAQPVYELTVSGTWQNNAPLAPAFFLPDGEYKLYTAPQPAAQAQPAAWKMDKDTCQFLSDVMTAAGLVEHGKQCKALAERLSSGVMAVRKTFQAHWAPDPNQKIVKVDCGDYYQWQAAPAQAQPACQPPKSWNKRGQDAYRRGWEDRGNSMIDPAERYLEGCRDGYAQRDAEVMGALA